MASSAGDYFSFNENGTVNAEFFGFAGGGPNGNCSISSSPDSSGQYTLQATHITGGTSIYKVRVISKNEIELHAERQESCGSTYYRLTRH